jgi:hypothetical protein
MSGPSNAPRGPRPVAPATPSAAVRGPGGSNSTAHQQHQRIVEQARAKEDDGKGESAAK